SRSWWAARRCATRCAVRLGRPSSITVPAAGSSRFEVRVYGGSQRRMSRRKPIPHARGGFADAPDPRGGALYSHRLEAPMFKPAVSGVILVAALEAATSVHAQSASVSVDLGLTSGSPAIAGTEVDFAITVNNEGPDPAASVELDFAVPAGTSFSSLATP